MKKARTDSTKIPFDISVLLARFPKFFLGCSFSNTAFGKILGTCLKISRNLIGNFSGIGSKSILTIFFVLVFFVMPSCNSVSVSSDAKLTAEEHRALESLFSHFLLHEGGAYTLFGSKPLSFDVISQIPEEEKQEFLSFSSHPVIKNELNFSENWNIWKRVRDRYPMSRFLLVERKPPAFSSGESSVFLVNIAAVASLLEKHYPKFRAAVREDFDPLDIVFEIEDDGSAFWETVLARDDLLGILLGYGEENAKLFWEIKAREAQMSAEKTSQKQRFLASLSTQTPGSNSLSAFDATFPLPCFGCYAPDESSRLIKQYENERRAIKKIYRGRDFVRVTLDRLTSNDLPLSPDKKYQEKLARELKIEKQLAK